MNVIHLTIADIFLKNFCLLVDYLADANNFHLNKHHCVICETYVSKENEYNRKIVQFFAFSFYITSALGLCIAAEYNNGLSFKIFQSYAYSTEWMADW